MSMVASVASEPDMSYVSHMRNALSITHMRNNVGRIKRWAEDMQARFPAGTFDRIAAVLEPDEDRTEFVRRAVDRELARRERAKSASGSR
jgi:hypothetical protein